MYIVRWTVVTNSEALLARLQTRKLPQMPSTAGCFWVVFPLLQDIFTQNHPTAGAIEATFPIGKRAKRKISGS